MFDVESFVMLKCRNMPKFRIKIYKRLHLYLKRKMSILAAFQAMAENQPDMDNKALCSIFSSRATLGFGLRDLFRDIFPDDEVALLEAFAKRGGNDGGLENGFAPCIALAESKSKILSSAEQLAYPLFLLVALLSILIYLSSNVFPKLGQIVDLDQSSLYSFSVFLSDYWFLSLVAAVSMLGYLVWYIVFGKGVLRDKLSAIPPFSFYQGIKQAGMLQVMSSLLAAGVNVKESLVILSECSKGWAGYHFSEMQNNLKVLGSLEEAFDTGFFDKKTLKELQAFSRFSDIDLVMIDLSIESSDKVKNQANFLAKIIGFFTLISVFGLIGSMFTLITSVNF